MAKAASDPHVGIVTDDEIAQAICNFFAKRQMGIDPELHDIDFKVTYRNVKDSSGSLRLFASIAITNVKPITKASPEKEPA